MIRPLLKIVLAFILAALLMPLTACTHGPTAPVEPCYDVEKVLYYSWNGRTLQLDSVKTIKNDCPSEWTWA